MDSVIIASETNDEAHRINETVKKKYKATQIPSPGDLEGKLSGARLIILDQNFTESNSLDFLSRTLKTSIIPILYLAAPDDIETTKEALKRGAFNVVHKVPNYNNFLNLYAEKAITEFNEKQKLYRGIKTLKQKVDNLENTEKAGSKKAQGESQPGQIKEENILDQIVFVFKRGEIDLPSPPHIGIRFRELLAQKANLQNIGDLLSKDMAISSKLISISNSAYYRGVNQNKNLTQAISRLGIDTTKQYVEAILNRTLYIIKNKKFAGYIESLWEHSLSCAYAAQIIQEKLKLNLQEDVFTLALFHDIGKLIIFKIIAELQLKKKLGDTVENMEVMDTVDKNHAKFGASLLKLWKFSSEYLRVASYHDNMEGVDHKSEELLVVNFANQLVKSMGFNHNENSDVDLSSIESASLLKLDEEMVESVKEKVKLMMDELGGYLK